MQKDTKGTGANIDYAVADDLTGTPVPASALSHDGSAGLVRDHRHNSTQVDSQLNFTTGRRERAPGRHSGNLDRDVDGADRRQVLAQHPGAGRHRAV